MPQSVLALRELLERRFPDAVPVAQRAAPALATGVDALDRILPGGGLPRGRLSTWMPGTGTVALLRTACLSAAARGERVAWVDAARAAPPDAPWSDVLLVRPPADVDALGCAEELLRCGGLGLIVLAGAESKGAARTRLGRAAREGGSAYLEMSADGWMAAVRLGTEVEPGGYRWRRSRAGEPLLVESVDLRVRATALGWSEEATLSLPVAEHEQRLALPAGLVDRRGVRTGSPAYA